MSRAFEAGQGLNLRGIHTIVANTTSEKKLRAIKWYLLQSGHGRIRLVKRKSDGYIEPRDLTTVPTAEDKTLDAWFDNEQQNAPADPGVAFWSGDTGFYTKINGQWQAWNKIEKGDTQALDERGKLLQKLLVKGDGLVEVAWCIVVCFYNGQESIFPQVIKLECDKLEKDLVTKYLSIAVASGQASSYNSTLPMIEFLIKYSFIRGIYKEDRGDYPTPAVLDEFDPSRKIIYPNQQVLNSVRFAVTTNMPGCLSSRFFNRIPAQR